MSTENRTTILSYRRIARLWLSYHQGNKIYTPFPFPFPRTNHCSTSSYGVSKQETRPDGETRCFLSLYFFVIVYDVFAFNNSAMKFEHLCICIHMVLYVSICTWVNMIHTRCCTNDIRNSLRFVVFHSIFDCFWPQ